MYKMLINYKLYIRKIVSIAFYKALTTRHDLSYEFVKLCKNIWLNTCFT